MSRRGTPCCPNHGCEMDPTGEATRWICPMSGALFAADVTPQGTTQRLTAWGTIETVSTLTCVDGKED